jgi:hypothetical protein
MTSTVKGTKTDKVIEKKQVAWMLDADAAMLYAMEIGGHVVKMKAVGYDRDGYAVFAGPRNVAQDGKEVMPLLVNRSATTL